MRVKLDEDLSSTVATQLATRGIEVLTVLGQGWGGWKDPDLWQRVLAEQIFFITADKGFGDIRSYPPGKHAGILLLRPDRDTISEYRNLIDRVLQNHSLASLAGCLTVASPRSIRIRREPPKDKHGGAAGGKRNG